MVFTTVESSITKSGKALGVFKKDWHDIIYDINNTTGLGNKIKAAFSTGLSQKDIDSLKEYNTEIKNGRNAQSAFYEKLQGTSSAAQNLAAQANGAAVSEEALANATNKTTVATNLLNGALRMLANIGIALAINLIISGITHLVNRVKEIKESTDNLISSFKSLKSEADSLAKNSNTLVSEYAKLSKGVNNLGENVSLTSDEYERYKELANQIAEDIPSLIIGYDNEGNAILGLKDNVDELKQSYIEARKEKYNLMLTEDKTTDDAITNYKHLKTPSNWSSAFDFGKPHVGGGISAKKAAEVLRNTINSSYEEVIDSLPDIKIKSLIDVVFSDEDDYLSSFGLDKNTTEEEFLELQKVFRTELKTLEAEVEKGLTSIKDIANMYLFTNDDYYNLSDEMQNIASVMINSIPDDLAETWEDKYDINEYVEGIVDKLKNASPDIQLAYRHLFNLSLNDLSISEAKGKVDGLLKELADYLGIDANQLKVQLGFEVVDENKDELDHILERATNKYGAGKKVVERSLLRNSLSEGIDERGINTKEELAILAECIDSTNSASAALELYDEKVKQAKSDNAEAVRSLDELKEAYDKISDSASKFTSNQKTLTDALDEQKEHGQLSASTIQSLVDAGYAQALVTDKVTGAVTFNIKEYERLNEQKRQAIILDIEQQQIELDQKFKEESKAITDLATEMGYANQERREAIALEMQQHGLTMADIQAQISALDALSASTTAPTFESSSSGSSSKDETPQSIIDFEKELARRQHEIKMGRMEEDATYFDWLEKAYREAYKGLTGYQDDIYKYEEMVYDGRKKLAEDFYNEQKKYHDNRVEELESQITVAEDKSTDSNGNSLNPAEKFDYIRASYSDIIAELERRINEIVSSGIEGHEDEVKELEKQIEEYSDKLQNVFKDEIDYEIDYIETIQKKYNDFIDQRIDRYEDEKKAIEDKYDAEIKSIDETIDALKGKNNETSKAIELKNAMQDLENSKQRTRMVYGSDGTITYRQDTEKVEEAQQKVDDIKLDILIDSLEKQKEAKEAEKDAALQTYETMVTDLGQQKKDRDQFFSDVLEKLDNINNPQSTESIDRIIDKAYADDPKEAERIKQKLKDSDIENSEKKNSNKSDDDTVKKASLSKSETKSANENKANVQIEQTSNMDTFMKLLYSMSGKEPDSYERWKRGEYDESNKFMSNIFSDDAFIGGVMKHLEDAMNSFSETLVRSEIANVEKQHSVNVSIGDIHIDNPVGDVEQFAKELMLNVDPVFERQINTNLKW